MPSTIIYTIGHSTRTIEEFITILKHYQIAVVVDVRTIPRSRYNPQFNEDLLATNLKKASINYIHFEELGGLRQTIKNSLNMGWRNASFRGYADYMQTDSFSESLGKLISLAKEKTVVIMCAEAVPWRCHRSLIGDALSIRDIEVKDIISLQDIKSHTLTSFAKVKGLGITYPEIKPDK